LLLLLLEQVVVRRLKLLRVELAGIVDSKRWAGEISVRGSDELAALARYARELVTIVQQQVQELKSLSQTDALTGLPNRRAFDERLELVLAQFARQKMPAALILMDVDFFKKYNDTYGHPAGDDALQTIAQCLRTSLRRELDMPARLGGEEFGVLLQGVTAEQACAAAEHLRTSMQSMALAHSANPPLHVMTMSLGVAVVAEDDNAATLYRRADEALYQAKNQGRNRVHQA
jgi:diguanylate cyclase (GGDEF)-like protein